MPDVASIVSGDRLRGRYVELLADRADGPRSYLRVAWHGGWLPARPAPLGVVATFTDEAAAVLAQVALKVSSLHAA
jgi:hypothetical protein